MSYEEYCGLWFNVPRVRFQWAAMTLAGAAAASHNKPLEDIWADAVARFPAELQTLLEDMNIARQIAAIGDRV